MKNADLFKDTFGTYATEIWSMSENDFLKWLNEYAKPKTGHWIYELEDWNKWTCSECGWSKRTDVHVKLGYNFCPNCGCAMVEPQESDHKCHTCKHYTSGENDGSCGSYICKGYSNWESEG